MKILLKVALNSFSGYGNDGIGLTEALVKAGHDVYLVPSAVASPLPGIVTDLLRKTPQPPYDLSLTHLDPMSTDVSAREKAACDLVVGWTMWEYTSLNVTKGWKKAAKKLRKLDKLFVYDQVTYDALYPVVPGVEVEILQGGFDPKPWQAPSPFQRDWTGQFRFCMVGALHVRKDPWVAIDAFKELRADGDLEHAELHLKTSEQHLPEDLEEYIPMCRVHTGTWTAEVLAGFYRNCHVLLSPSRGEGKNVPALEFMTTGGTVIATNWGGHKGWLTDDVGYPLNYSMHLLSQDRPAEQARASKQHLKELMSHVYANQTEARQKGITASLVIPEQMSWDTKVRQLEEALQR